MERRAELLKKQGEDGGEIARLHRNFFKDGPNRWMEPGYVEKKRKVLDELWVRFEKRHKRILNEPLFKDIPYFEKNCFEFTKQYYEDVCTRLAKVEREMLHLGEGSSVAPILENVNEELIQPLTTEDPEVSRTLQDLARGADEELKESPFFNERIRCRDEMTDFLSFIEETVIEADDRKLVLNDAQLLFSTFENAHSKAIPEIPPERQSDARKEFFSIKLRFQRLCKKCGADGHIYDTVATTPVPRSLGGEASADIVSPGRRSPAHYNDQSQAVPIYEDVELHSTPHAKKSSQPESPADGTADPNGMYGVLTSMMEEIRHLKSNSLDNSDVKLTRVSLPNFSGRRDERPNFYDLFTSLVHNHAQYSNTTKMSYLRTHVVGEAAKILVPFTNIGANYESAWQMLVDRYHNPKAMINHALEQLFKLKPVPHEDGNLL